MPFKALRSKHWRRQQAQANSKRTNAYLETTAHIDPQKNVTYEPSYQLQLRDLEQAAQWYDEDLGEEGPCLAGLDRRVQVFVGPGGLFS